MVILQQYWVGKEPYRHVPVAEIAAAFSNYKVGKRNAELLSKPFPKEESHPAALVTTQYALGSESNRIPSHLRGIWKGMGKTAVRLFKREKLCGTGFDGYNAFKCTADVAGAFAGKH